VSTQATLPHPRDERCTYHPCRNFDRPVGVGEIAFCHHGEHCPFSQRHTEPRSFRVWPAVAVAASVLLIVAGLLFGLSPRAGGMGGSFWSSFGMGPRLRASVPPQMLPATRTTSTYDYAREVEELVSFSRQILEKTDAIRVFEEQITDSPVPLPETTRDRWLSGAERKRRERADLCNVMVKKLGLMIHLDQASVDQVFARLPDQSDSGIDSDRREKSVALARTQWNFVKRTANLTPQDLIASAEALMPF
jgi:hypothetical protein